MVWNRRYATERRLTKALVGGYQGWEETIVADTLNVFDNTESRTAILVVYVEDDNPKRSGGEVMHISYDVTSTLRANTKHHEPIVLCLEHHPADSRILIKDDDICQSLTSRMGTGGGNVPLIMTYGTDNADRETLL